VTEPIETPAEFEPGSPNQLGYLGRLHRPIRGADPGIIICAQQCRIEHGRDRGNVQIYPCKTARALGLTAPELPPHAVLGRLYPVTTRVSGSFFALQLSSQIELAFIGEGNTQSTCAAIVRFEMDDNNSWTVELKDKIWGIIGPHLGTWYVTFIFGRPRP
jgi:hypothetical protein